MVELKNSIFVRTCSLLVDNFTRLLYMIFIGTNVYSYVVRLVLCYVSPSPHRPFPRSLAYTHDLCFPKKTSLVTTSKIRICAWGRVTSGFDGVGRLFAWMFKKSDDSEISSNVAAADPER